MPWYICRKSRVINNRILQPGEKIELDELIATSIMKRDQSIELSTPPEGSQATNTSSSAANDASGPARSSQTAIESLNIPPRTLKILKELGFNTVEELREVEDLEALDGIGRAMAASIQAALNPDQDQD